MGRHENSNLAIFLVLVLACSWEQSFSAPLPFILFHGFNTQCSNPGPIWYMKRLTQWSKAEGHCMEIGNGTWTSWFSPLEKQVAEACQKVKAMKDLSNGYNIVGLSQGNLIGRGVVEFCDGGPPVRNFISVGGPQAGIASVPECGHGIFCVIVDSLIKEEIYTDYVQAHLAPSGFLKLPNNFLGYLSKCRFLPKLNNEQPDERNAIYKERFASLRNLVLIMFENDTVLVPKETSWFGYYPDGAFSPVLAPHQDWIGLKTLDDAGRVRFIAVPGEHLAISEVDMMEYVIPYLNDDASEEGNIRPGSVHLPRADKNLDKLNGAYDGSSNYQQPSPTKSTFGESAGVKKDD